MTALTAMADTGKTVVVSAFAFHEHRTRAPHVIRRGTRAARFARAAACGRRSRTVGSWRRSLEVAAGPRVFDVRCIGRSAPIWHWVGTSDQIVRALEEGIARRHRQDSDKLRVTNTEGADRSILDSEVV